jgi:cysteine synthase
MDLAREMAARDPDLFDVDQYENQRNPDAYYHTLGQEIWQQTQGSITHFVCAGSTGGTITGVGRRLKETNPSVRIVMADPEGSVFYDYFEYGTVVPVTPTAIEGIGKQTIPGAIDMSVVDEMLRVSDENAFATCRRLAEREGLMAGGSSGLNVFAALQLAENAQGPACIVTILPDSGLKYLSKIYNDEWLSAR